MASYSLAIEARALEGIASIGSKNDRKRVRERIDALADDPRPPGAVKLQGYDDTWRVRQGNYRIIYEIADRLLRVVVVQVGDRKEVYRRR